MLGFLVYISFAVESLKTEGFSKNVHEVHLFTIDSLEGNYYI